MSAPATVGIGLPVYNGERFISAALSSLREQSFGDIEIFISDNASTDGTEEICRAAAAADSRVTYSRAHANAGPIANFNRALEHTRGLHFMWAACDDLWHPSFIEKLLPVIRDDAECSIAFCLPCGMDANGVKFADTPKFPELVGVDRFDGMRRYLHQREDCGKASAIYGLMRREQVRAIGGLTSRGADAWGFDMQFVFQMLTMGRLRLVHEPLFMKRVIVEPRPEEKPRRGRSPGELIARLPRAVKARFLNRWHDYRTFREYVRGYREVIELASGLSRLKRARLRLDCAVHLLARVLGPL